MPKNRRTTQSIADRLPPVFSWLENAGLDPADVGAAAVFLKR
jgi:hypothetical protein